MPVAELPGGVGQRVGKAPALLACAVNINGSRASGCLTRAAFQANLMIELRRAHGQRFAIPGHGQSETKKSLFCRLLGFEITDSAKHLLADEYIGTGTAAVTVARFHHHPAFFPVKQMRGEG